MFPLSRTALPTGADDLREAIEESLRNVVTPAGPMVVIDDRSYPELASIRVSLDGATVVDRPIKPEPLTDSPEPAFRVDDFAISGNPLLLQGAPVQLRCQARQVELGQAHDRSGNVVLTLISAAQGSIELATSVKNLEALILSGAKAAAAAQGVSVENVRVRLQNRSDRSLDAEVQVRAKKLFLSATVRINGSVEIDDQLNARLSNLECNGEGALGSVACGFLSPYLQRFNSRQFPLAALPLGEIKLRDIRLVAGDELHVTAQFGA